MAVSVMTSFTTSVSDIVSCHDYRDTVKHLYGEKFREQLDDSLVKSVMETTKMSDYGRNKTMFGEIKKDMTNFVLEYRGVIYFVLIALVVDHLVFRGVFRARLQNMVERLIEKAEEKVA